MFLLNLPYSRLGIFLFYQYKNKNQSPETQIIATSPMPIVYTAFILEKWLIGSIFSHFKAWIPLRNIKAVDILPSVNEGDSFLPTPLLVTGIDASTERSGDERAGLPRRTGATGPPGPENILRGVRIRMIGMSAGNAPEGGLVRTVLHRNVSAEETGPARVFGIHPNQPSSPPLQLVCQEGEKRSPPPGQEGAVQPGLLPDLSSGGLFRSPGAFGHVPDLQVLDNHDGLGFADRSRDLVEKIQAHVGDPFVGSRHPDLLLPDVPALRPLPVFPGEIALLPE